MDSVELDIGELRHLVSLYKPGPIVADGDGGYTQQPIALSPPTMRCSIIQATARDLERTVSNTVMSMATHVVTMRYHPQVTTETWLTPPDGARLNIVSVDNVKRRNIKLVLACVEVVQ